MVDSYYGINVGTYTRINVGTYTSPMDAMGLALTPTLYTRGELTFWNPAMEMYVPNDFPFSSVGDF